MIFPTFFLITSSIFISTGLVLCNKNVMSRYHFEYPTFLTSFHFLLASITLRIMGRMKLFEVSDAVPRIKCWIFAFFGVVAIVSMNFNLKLNSIGFYQLSKLCNIPCLVLYDYLINNKKTPFNTLISLVVLFIGLCLFTVNDVQLNIYGFIVSIIAVVSTAVYQSQTNTLQRQYSIKGIQLNYVSMPPQFIICFFSAFVIETHGKVSIFNHSFQLVEAILILSTGIFAILGNIVGFSLIGKAGAVTFQVVGHVKTMLIFIFGLILFPSKHESIDQFRKKILGLSVSMVGVVLYTIFEIRNKNESENSKSQLVDETNETKPFLSKEDNEENSAL